MTLTLNDIPDVVIDADGGNKFVVCRLTAPSGEAKLIVRADAAKVWHADIVKGLEKGELAEALYAEGFTMACLGGGMISRDAANKKITINGASTAYGNEPDRAETVRLLQHAFPDYEVSQG